MTLVLDPPQVTVVVRARSSATTIEACLRSTKAQTVPAAVVVVDNGSSDGRARLAQKLTDLVTGGDPSAMVVPEQTIGEGYWRQVGMFERSFYVGSEHVEAAGFYRWDVFEKLGGFYGNLTGPEDWDLTIPSRHLGPVERIEAMINHEEGQVRYLDACRKKGRCVKGLRRFTLKHGADTMGRAAFGRPYPCKPVALKSPLGARLVALKAGELVSVTVTITRNQLSAWPRGRAAAECCA
jgi:hypothetical protein